MPRHRSHIALTVWPLAVLFVVELDRLWPALRGASSFAEASPASWLSLLVWTSLILVSLGAYARGWSILVPAPEGSAGPYRSDGCRRLQNWAGGLAWALVVSQLALHWVMTVRVGPVAISHYELLRGFLSRPAVMVFYVIGIGALGLFLSQGFAASFRAWGLGQGAKNSRWLEIAGTLTSVVMMLIAINVLSHFVTGRAYWMGP